MNASTATLADLQTRVADLEQQLATVARERDEALARLADCEQSDEEFLQRIDSGSHRVTYASIAFNSSLSFF